MKALALAVLETAGAKAQTEPQAGIGLVPVQYGVTRLSE